jgi:hypothetical protein
MRHIPAIENVSNDSYIATPSSSREQQLSCLQRAVSCGGRGRRDDDGCSSGKILDSVLKPTFGSIVLRKFWFQTIFAWDLGVGEKFCVRAHFLILRSNTSSYTESSLLQATTPKESGKRRKGSREFSSTSFIQ